MTRAESEALLVVTGATGLVGGRLLHRCAGRARVRAVTRDPARAAGRLPAGVEIVGWDGLRLGGDAIAGARALIHLAGEPILGGLRRPGRLERARASRVDSTRALAGAVAALPPRVRPELFLCASAVGIYGDRGDELLDESAAPGSGGLAPLCRAWEEAASEVEAHGVRRVSLRIGIVLAREGGALAAMSRIFRLGLGGRLGSGRQWVPWIATDDLADLILFCVESRGLAGAVNAVAPEPVRNRELTRLLARRLKRPGWARVPAPALRLVLGPLARELLDSRRVVPRRALEEGFRFRAARLEEALAAEL